MALEYFPESLLSVPVDLNTTYYESGRIIPDSRGFSYSPVRTGNGRGVAGGRSDGCIGRGRGRGRKVFGVADDGAAHSPGPLRRLLSHAKRRAFFSRRAHAVTAVSGKAEAGPSASTDAAAAAVAAATASRKSFADGTPPVATRAGIHGTKDGQEERQEEEEEEEEGRGKKRSRELR